MLARGGTGAGLATAPPTQTALGEAVSLLGLEAEKPTRSSNVWACSVVPEDYMFIEGVLSPKHVTFQPLGTFAFVGPFLIKTSFSLSLSLSVRLPVSVSLSAVLGIGPRASCLLAKCFITKLYP